MGFELSPDYKQVPERIADFKQKHPEGCLRPVNPEVPYEVVTVNGCFFIVYAAAAYRTPDDPTPGIGVAWEPFPGRTPYTKDSELQNAETSAWGRAIVAVLASESKAVASAEDVRNRQAEAAASQEEVDQRRQEVKDAIDELTPEQTARLQAWAKAERLPPRERITVAQADKALAFIASLTEEDTTEKGAGAEGPVGDGDAALSGDGADGHDVGRSVPEPAPARQGKGAGSALHDPAPDPTQRKAGRAAANGARPAPDATQVPAGVDIVAELDHEYSQLGGVQKAAFDAWCRKAGLPESRADASRADVLAAIEKARELRSHTGPIDVGEAEAEQAS